MEQAKKTSTDFVNQGMDEVTKLATEAAKEAAASAGPPKPPLRGVPGFFRAFGKEIQKDFGSVQNK
jgi:streptomycin 6-kinase